MPNSFTDLHVHLVWATFDRLPCLSTENIGALAEFSAGVLKNIGCHGHNFGGYQNHVHLLTQIPPTKTVAEVAQLVKANSSRWLERDRGIAGFRWQGAYSAFSVSPSRIEVVSKYIDRQEEHHRKKSFQEEIDHMLEAAGRFIAR